MSGNNNNKAKQFKRKILSKYRIRTAKQIRLAKLQTRAARSTVLYSDSSDDNNTICSFENLTDFDPESDNSFEREVIDFQENDTPNSDHNSDSNFDLSNNSINNCSENNSTITDYMDENRDNDGVEQDYNIHSDVNLESNFNNEEQVKNYLLNMLREWALRGVSKKKIDALLTLLRPIFPFLPKSHKTLLRSSRKVIVNDMDNGLFWYKGVKLNIRQLLSDEYIRQHGEIAIDVNIDGIPLSKSSEMHFWPILGKFRDFEHPFLIAVCLGPGKPSDVNIYLNEFVVEAADLQENGFQWSDGNIYQFRIVNYVLDAEARSFVKQCIAHGGYHGCEKCTVRGTYYKSRMCFFEQDCPLRTDESFCNRNDPYHHVGNSILEDIGTGMVSQFRLDALHLVYLGVVKRMLHFLISVRSRCTLPNVTVFEINNVLNDIAGFFPLEFTRKPRSFGVRNKREKWKVTEFRRFILYDCIFVLKDRVPNNIYQCFLFLHCAIYILCRHDLFETMNEIADYLLREFVKQSAHSFGREIVVYNVHSLVHLPKECRNRSTLDSFNTFPYENFLGVIKSQLRSTHRPLQQLANKDMETLGALVNPSPRNDFNFVTLKKPFDGYNLPLEGQQYATVITKDFTLSTNQANRYFKTIDDEVVRLYCVIDSPRGIIVVGKRFKRYENYYTFPIESSKLGIFKVSEFQNTFYYCKIEDVKEKCVIMPDSNDTFFCIPFIPFFH